MTNDAWLSLVESFRVLLGTTILCHKEPARRNQRPIEPLLVPRWFFMAQKRTGARHSSDLTSSSGVQSVDQFEKFSFVFWRQSGGAGVFYYQLLSYLVSVLRFNV